MPTIYICDKCGKKCEDEYKVEAIEVSKDGGWISYPVLVFCSWNCLRNYLDENIEQFKSIKIEIWRNNQFNFKVA